MLKAPRRIVAVGGTEIVRSAAQFSKQPAPISTTPSGRTTRSSALQSAKTPRGSRVTPLGTTTSVIAVPRKAFAPIDPSWSD